VPLGPCVAVVIWDTDRSRWRLDACFVAGDILFLTSDLPVGWFVGLPMRREVARVLAKLGISREISNLQFSAYDNL
jgi:hypothetical protein